MGVQHHLSASGEQRFPLVSELDPLRRRARPLHVLTLTPFYPVEGDDGAGCFIAEPVSAVSKLGIETTVLFASPFYRKAKPISAASPPASSLRYFSLPKGLGLASSGAFLFGKIVGQMGKLGNRSPVNLIHAHGALPCGHAAYLLSRELGIPYVVTVHGLDAYSTRQVKGIPRGWCERVSRMTYQGARRVICISERVREEVEMGGHFAVEVVYNGVDTELFSPVRETGNSDLVILSVGNLVPIKGHDLLLRAVAALQKQFPSLRCEIVGEGPDREHLSKLAKQLQIRDRVNFRGRLSRRDLAATLRRCTVFALPSRYEALGCVYLEAMATGKAIVACSGQGIGDIVRSGQNGLLIPPDNVDELTRALASLVADSSLRQSIAAAGHRTVHQHLTLTRQAEALARIYEECAS